MPNIRPFRDYDEHEVVNLFGVSGSYPINKGTFVKIAVGWNSEQEIRLMGSIGASYPNAVNERFGVSAWVTPTSSGELPLGMILRDCKEVDENGYPLKWDQSKADAIGCVVSGQANPILRRGMVLYSGINGTVAAGTKLYTTAGGELATSGTSAHYVGKALGPKDTLGFALIDIDL